MMHNTHTLYEELNRAHNNINQQITAVIQETDKRISVLPYPDDVTVYDMRNSDGTPVLAQLLAAKAQLLSGMAALKAADVASKKGKAW